MSPRFAIELPSNKQWLLIHCLVSCSSLLSPLLLVPKLDPIESTTSWTACGGDREIATLRAEDKFFAFLDFIDLNKRLSYNCHNFKKNHLEEVSFFGELLNLDTDVLITAELNVAALTVELLRLEDKLIVDGVEVMYWRVGALDADRTDTVAGLAVDVGRTEPVAKGEGGGGT